MTDKVIFCLHRARLFWPTTVLVMMLQRTPVLRMLVATEGGSGPRLGQMLRAAFPAVAGVLAVNTLTGATRFTANPASPASATVGASFSAVYAVTGAPSTPRSYTFSGLPPGLSVTGGSLNGATWTVNGSNASVGGTPTTAGNYPVSIRAWANQNGTGDHSPIYSYVIDVTGGSSNSPPTFTTNPNSRTVNAGSSVSFTVAVSGSPTPTLQWIKGGVNIAGQTGTTLSLSNVTAADAGNYACTATNVAGTVTSSLATLTVNAATAAPAFTTQPASQTVTAGGSASFTVAVSGSPAPTLQWRKGTTNLAGQTGATLSLAGVSASDAGNYTCVASNSAGSATSAIATLTVTAAATAPVFTTSPTSQSVAAGTSASFTVAVSGSPAPTLQWRKGTTNLAGETGTTLTLASVGAADAASYDCVATNSAGSTTSAVAVLSVVASAAPTITMQPVAMTSPTGGGAYFAIQATGSGITYQWFKNGIAIAGATQSSLYLSGVQSGDAGSYTAVVTDSSGGQVSSDAASLIVTSTGSARLVNMSARAGVGTGADVLIPGFVIEGNVSLTLLVRGIGPHLSNYGVAAVLQDPVMSLHRGDALVATNDNWEESPNLDALKLATTATGAFPLAAGSKDCAMLVTLNPGLYTVTVSGKDGLTGVALVELYVVGQ